MLLNLIGAETMSMQMSDMQKSFLIEAGNIGSGHAAIALSRFLNKKIMISVPSVDIIEISRLKMFFPDKSKNYVQITFKVSEQAQCVVLFSMEEEKARKLCDIVLELPYSRANNTAKIASDIEKSAIKEIGIIVGTSYINAISELTGLKLSIQSSNFTIGDMESFFSASSVLNRNLADETNVICIKTEFLEESSKIEGYLIFIPENEAIEKIFERFGLGKMQ